MVPGLMTLLMLARRVVFDDQCSALAVHLISSHRVCVCVFVTVTSSFVVLFLACSFWIWVSRRLRGLPRTQTDGHGFQRRSVEIPYLSQSF